MVQKTSSDVTRVGMPLADSRVCKEEADRFLRSISIRQQSSNVLHPDLTAPEFMKADVSLNFQCRVNSSGFASVNVFQWPVHYATKKKRSFNEPAGSVNMKALYREKLHANADRTETN